MITSIEKYRTLIADDEQLAYVRLNINTKDAKIPERPYAENPAG